MCSGLVRMELKIKMTFDPKDYSNIRQISLWSLWKNLKIHIFLIFL